MTLPSLQHVDPAAVRRGHIVRVTESEILSASDAYGAVRATKHMGGGYWRIRWDLLSRPQLDQPNTGILHIHPGELVSCVSREQWQRMSSIPYPVRNGNEGETL